MVDYVLTVAVSISSAACRTSGLRSPSCGTHEPCSSRSPSILLLTAVNLRGIRESGTAFALPTYAFIVGIALMLVWGSSASTVSDHSAA